YNTTLFETATINAILGHWQVLLHAIVHDPLAHLQDLPLLNDQERQQLLVEWNQPQQTFPITTSLHEQFEQQVHTFPTRIAVVAGQEELTYAQLNAQANHLARHLPPLGVVPNQLVGLCLERSAHMLVGLLAILKAGGAYL